MNNIFIFKLVDGSFIVGKLNKDDEIVEALEIMIMPSQMGQMNMAMVPLMYPFNNKIENDIIIDKNKILLSMEANEDIISKYIEATVGIVSPKSIFTN